MTYCVAAFLVGDYQTLMLSSAFSLVFAVVSLFLIPSLFDWVFDHSRKHALMDWVGSSGSAGWCLSKGLPDLFAVIMPFSLLSSNLILANLPGLLAGLTILFWLILPITVELGRRRQQV